MNGGELEQFLLSRQSLFAAPNSEFFKKRPEISHDVIDFMKGVRFEEMKRIPECYTQGKDCPAELSRFFSDCARLSILGEPCTSQPEKQFPIKSVKPKKAYEISRFVEFLHPLCAKHGINRIVDVGCGIGHLLRTFNSRGFRFQLVGVECNEEFIRTGQKLSGDIEYVNVFLSDDTSSEDMDRIVGDNPDNRTAIVSLHGCGDLQPFLLRLFSRLPRENFPLLATVACCYHKMSPGSFPMNKDVSIRLPPSALRLACEQRLKRLEDYSIEDHRHQAFSFIVKGIIECFYERLGIDVSSKPRGFCRYLGSSMPDVIDAVLKRNLIEGAEAQEWRRIFNETVDEHKEMFDFAQHYVILQLALQAPLESLILSDRLTFLLRNGCERSQLIPLFNSSISPRNMVIIAE